MNDVPDVAPLDYATVEAEVTARDREVANRFTKDGQITAIRGARALLRPTGSARRWRRIGSPIPRPAR